MTRKSLRRLRMERLEDRDLLAVAAFATHLWEDNAGSPGAELEQIQQGRTFFLEITAEETHPLFAGLTGVALDLQWDPAVLSIVEESFTPAAAVTAKLPFRLGELDQPAGQIHDLVGSVFFQSGQPIGANGPERFALLKFQALSTADQTNVSMREGLSGISTFPFGGKSFHFEDMTFAVVPEPIESPMLNTELPLVEPTELEFTEAIAAAGEGAALAEPVVTLQASSLAATPARQLAMRLASHLDESGNFDNIEAVEDVAKSVAPKSPAPHAVYCEPEVATRVASLTLASSAEAEPASLPSVIVGPHPRGSWPQVQAPAVLSEPIRLRRAVNVATSQVIQNTHQALDENLLDLLAASRLARGQQRAVHWSPLD